MLRHKDNQLPVSGTIDFPENVKSWGQGFKV